MAFHVPLLKNIYLDCQQPSFLIGLGPTNVCLNVKRQYGRGGVWVRRERVRSQCVVPVPTHIKRIAAPLKP